MRDSAADKLVTLIPKLVRMLRSEMRQASRGELSVPQFRILANIHNGTQTTSAIAELHGISLPATSKLVDGLVKRGYIKRLTLSEDRRVIRLNLSAKGIKTYQTMSLEVRRKFEKALEILSAKECQALLDGLTVLERFWEKSNA
jgi:DNA-binding MarR family transcriptional regulator